MACGAGSQSKSGLHLYFSLTENALTDGFDNMDFMDYGEPDIAEGASLL